MLPHKRYNFLFLNHLWYFYYQLIQFTLSDNLRLSLASKNDNLIAVGFTFLLCDSVIQASLMAHAALSVQEIVLISIAEVQPILCKDTNYIQKYLWKVLKK